MPEPRSRPCRRTAGPNRCRRSSRSPARAATPSIPSIPDACSPSCSERTQNKSEVTWRRRVDAMTVRMMMLVVAVWSAALAATQTVPRAAVALDNARVRAYRTTVGVLAGVAHGPGVVIWLRDGPGGKSGRAVWLDDVAVPPATGQSGDAIVIVQPLAQPAP